ncbi:MAG TPA: tetratricopeptide repeat protein [Acidimicrobiales bacterium]|nr:tetratricopeptide repeat protein [Acidimicrobiales bacterium]
MAVQDDRHHGPDQGLPAPISVDRGIDGGGADLAALTLAAASLEVPAGAGEAVAPPADRDDDPIPTGRAQERVQASLRALTDVFRRWYRPAERGHARALHTLGKILEERDAAKAEECFRWAARTGDIDAIADLGVMSAVRGDMVEAKGLLARAARSGHARAMYNLGVLSEGVSPERTEEWYRRAAGAGFADAMYNLGVHLEAHDAPEEAEKWYREAASAGHIHAMNNLGARLQRRRELRQAELWYRRAAQGGHSDAMNNMGAMLERRGQVHEAERWYRHAAEAGDVRGMANLAAALDRRGETDEAERWHGLADPNWTPRRSSPRRR